MGLPTEVTDVLPQTHGKGRTSPGATKQDGNWPLNAQAGKINPHAHGSTEGMQGEAARRKTKES